MNELRLSIALACVLLGGCDSLWNAANRSSLESDVRGLLKTAALEPRQIECRFVGATRGGFCALGMSGTEAASVIRTLSLESVRQSEEASPLARAVTQAGPGCVAGDAAPTAAYGIAGRPKSLRLPGGSAFEFLLLTIDESTGRACIQVSYSYG